MGVRSVFQLEESTIRAWRRCYNLAVTATIYAVAILFFTGLGIGYGNAMNWLATRGGFDEGKRAVVYYGGTSVFVVLAPLACR